MLEHKGPVVVNVHVTKDENCYPMVAPGKSNAQMFGLPKPGPTTVVESTYCNHCGTKNSSTHNFCSQCGSKL